MLMQQRNNLRKDFGNIRKRSPETQMSFLFQVLKLKKERKILSRKNKKNKSAQL